MPLLDLFTAEEIARLQMLQEKYPSVKMVYDPNLWERSQAEKMAERSLTKHLLATGQKTAAEVQLENSLFPRNVSVEIDHDYFRMLEEKRRKKIQARWDARRLRRLARK